MDGHGDDMKDSNLSQGAHVCEDENATTYLRECALRSVDVDTGERIVRCHASIHVVIGVRVMEFHASTHVVIGIRVVLCHPLIDFPLFCIFTSRPNSHLVVML